MTTKDERLAHAVRVLLEASGRVRRGVISDIEAATGLPDQWFETLLWLYRSTERCARMNEIASLVNLPASSFSRLVDQMEEAGLVVRANDPANRRATLLRTTPMGQARFAEAMKVHAPSIQARVGAHLSDEEIETLARLMTRLRDANG